MQRLCHTRSMIVAVPIPAPMQSVTSATPLPLRSNSSSAVRPASRGSAQRMAERDGAAVYIDLGVIKPEGLQIAENNSGEGLVDLEEVDVCDRHFRPRQQLSGHVDRTRQHHRGLRTDIGEARILPRGLAPIALARLFRADQHAPPAIDNARGIAGVMHVIDVSTSGCA